MQLTRFDRWLRRKFVYETHIYTMREIEAPPMGVAGFKLPDKQGQRFHYKYIVRSEKLLDELIATLNAQSMMFNTRVVDRGAWYVPILAPKGKSPTWCLVSFFTIMILISLVVCGAVLVWSDPEMRENILEAIDIFKG